MSSFLIAPFVIPLVNAILVLCFWNQRKAQRILHIAGNGILFMACAYILNMVASEGMLVTHLGSWPAPRGITYVADVFSGIMLTLSSLVAFIVSIYSLADINEEKQSNGYFFFCQTLMMGVSASFLTGDLFHLYVCYEIMLLSSFVLISLGGNRPQMEGSFKYVVLNLCSSTIFLVALGLIYGTVKTLNMADIAVKFQELETGMVMLFAMLLLVGFGIKSALFPMFFWLPASYHTPAASTSALFSGLLTKVGVYSLVRVYTLFFPDNPGSSFEILLVIACFTMVSGVLGAVAQMEFRKILSFHIVSQIGYMVLGLAFFSPLALAASIYYLIHNNLAKCNLFLIGGVAEKIHNTPSLKKMGSLYRVFPFLAFLFMVSAISLAGLPPTSGFWAKFFLFSAGLEKEFYIAVTVGVLVSICTLISMTKIWNYGFLTENENKLESNPFPTSVPEKKRRFQLLLPICIFATLSVVIGIGVQPVFEICQMASEQLMNPGNYIELVLEEVRYSSLRH